jgi:CDP-paratose 2-epimerase
MIEALGGARPHYEFQDWRPGDQRYYVSDTRKFRNATGWRPKVDPKLGLGKLYHELARGLEQGRGEVTGQRLVAAHRKSLARNGLAANDPA